MPQPRSIGAAGAAVDVACRGAGAELSGMTSYWKMGGIGSLFKDPGPGKQDLTPIISKDSQLSLTHDMFGSMGIIPIVVPEPYAKSRHESLARPRSGVPEI